MLEFNILEIQRNIEEKRLIWGEKLENFFLRKYRNFLLKADNFLKRENSALYFIVFSFLVSVFLRSNIDIGPKSGFFLAKNGFDNILLAELLINLIAIASIYFSSLILSKSFLKVEQINLSIFAFSLSFFFNKIFLPSNDFITSESFLLLLLFPFLSLTTVCFGIFVKNYSAITSDFVLVNKVAKISESKISNILKSFNSDFKIKKFSLIIIPASLTIVFPDSLRIIPESIFFALVTLLLIQIFYKFLNSKKFNFSKNKFVLTLILVFPFLDGESFLQLKEFIIFWWIILPIIAFSLYKKVINDFPESKQNLNNIISKSAYFLIFSFILFLQILQNNQSLLVLFSFLVTLVFLIFYENIYQSFYQTFSAFFAIFIFFSFSNLSSSYTVAVKKSYNFSNNLKPSFLSENIISYSNKNLKNSDEIVILSHNLGDIFPTLNYLGKTSKAYIYKDLFVSSDVNFLKTADNFKKHIFEKDIKILFINNFYDHCHIGFLEYYFKDENFKKLFYQNYNFDKRIFESETLPNKEEIEFFSSEKDIFDEVDLEKSQTLYDFSIYVRK